MSHDPIYDDLPPHTTPSEARELAATASRLRSERPIPAPGFRGELKRALVHAQDHAAAELLPPGRALARAGWCSCAGLALLAVAAAGLAGVGPFAPG